MTSENIRCDLIDVKNSLMSMRHNGNKLFSEWSLEIKILNRIIKELKDDK